MTAAQPAVPPDLRARVLDASRRARAAGEPVPEVPAISPAEAFSRAADALYRTLSALESAAWSRPAIRDLDVQGLVGHLTGVEDDVRRCLAGDPAVSLAGHVESTQAAAARQAGRDPAQSLAEWRNAVSRTLALVAARGHDSHDGLDTCVALHGMQLPLRALLVVRAFELWVHENDIRLAAGLPLAVPGPSVLSLMTRLAASLLPGAAVRAGVPGPGRLHLVLTGPGGGTWDLEWDPETASAARPGPAEVSIVADAVGFCRLVSDRMTPAELAPYITGDRDQAAEVLTAAATLALDLPEFAVAW